MDVDNAGLLCVFRTLAEAYVRESFGLYHDLDDEHGKKRLYL